MNVYPVDKSVISIPRMRIKSTTRSYDGTTTEESYMPTATKLIRANSLSVNVAPGSNVNVFTATGLLADNMKLNRRYTLASSIQIQEGGVGAALHNLSVSFKPDNRSQIAREFTFTDSGANVVTGNLNAHINFDKGIISLQVLYSGGTAGYTYTTNFVRFDIRFVPVATMNGRTKVEVETEMTDITIDPNEDFMIDLREEDLQDFSGIFKIDLLRTISEAVKRQILLNKD